MGRIKLKLVIAKQNFNMSVIRVSTMSIHVVNMWTQLLGEVLQWKIDEWER